MTISRLIVTIHMASYILLLTVSLINAASFSSVQKKETNLLNPALLARLENWSRQQGKWFNSSNSFYT